MGGSVWLKEPEYAIPKYATLVQGSFWARGIEKQQMHEEYSDLPFSLWKQEIKILYEICPPYTMRKGTFLSGKESSD